jgi:hypothetical protein
MDNEGIVVLKANHSRYTYAYGDSFRSCLTILFELQDAGTSFGNTLKIPVGK